MSTYRIELRRCLGALLLFSLAGCHTWNHAPGYGDRENLSKQVFPVVSGFLCTSGACDLQAPDGRVQFSDVRYNVSNKAREQTSFKVSYRGARAECAGPALVQGRMSPVPFACTIRTHDEADVSYSLELEPGCTRGKFERLRAADPDSRATWPVQTDEVEILGYRAPAREVSILDEEGPLVFSDAPNLYDRVLFGRPGRSMSPPLVLAVVATHAFVQMKGQPAECLVRR